MPEFKSIDRSIKYHPKKVVSVNLTSPYNSGMGMLLRAVYLYTDTIDLIKDLHTGLLYDDGYHSFSLKGPYLEVIAALELVRDIAPVKFHPVLVDAKNKLTEICATITTKVESKK